ncbi:MAG: CPBP family intramembrane metalloprotease [Chloroflexi bacterium]|nr:CPBP family intramembrane metalloprotease [Chloroflexota bacterium]
MNIKLFIQRHQLASYFVLAYGITWGSVLGFLASKGFRFDAIQMQDALVIFFWMIAGPSTSSLVLNALLDGRTGLRALWTRETHWRVSVRWWAIALLTIPVLILVILAVLSIVVAPAFAPGFQIFGLVIGLLAGGFEEIGWTGFAAPRLLKRHNALKAGFILGVAWALWHMLADFSGNITGMGSTGWLLWFTVYWLLCLPAYRMLMTWVYTKTQSLLVAQLMHASYTGWLATLSPATTSFSQNLVWQILFAASLWAMVAVVAVVERRKQNIKRVFQPLRRKNPRQ